MRIRAFTALLLLGSCVDATTPISDEPDVVAQAASTKVGARWPTRTITYFIDTSGTAAAPSQAACAQVAFQAMTSTEIQAVKDAITQVETQTPVRFARVYSTAYAGKDLLIFTHGTAPTAFSGGIPTGTSADYQGCVYMPAAGVGERPVEHEIGHMLGLQHEAQRSDRGPYVSVITSCEDTTTVGSGNWVMTPAGSDTQLTPFDFDSLMMYSSTFGCGCLDSTGQCHTAPLVRNPPYLKPGCNPATDPHHCLWIDLSSDLSQQDINALYYKYEPDLSAGLTTGGAELGFAMTTGDFDGDGYDDLAVGAPLGGAGKAGGVVFLYKGTEEGLTAWKVLRANDFGSNENIGDEFGYALTAADIDGDGDDDLAVGAPGYPGGGAVFVYHGKSGVGMRTGPAAASVYVESAIGIGGAIGNDYFGAALAFGKLDGTHWHLAVGAPDKASGTMSNVGLVYTMRLGTGTWNQIAESALAAPSSGDGFGEALQVLDVTGDGKDDLAVGAPQYGTSRSGRVLLYQSTTGALTGFATLTDASGEADGEFGSALASGRLLGNLKAELVVGAPGKASAAGRVYLYPQKPSSAGLDAANRVALAGANFAVAPVAGDRFGSSLAIGDLDGDLRDDLAIGAPDQDVDGVAAQGAVYLIRGGDGTVYSWSRKVEHADSWNAAAYDFFGRAVAIGGFGDASVQLAAANDVFDDLAIGIPGRDTATYSSGAIQYWFGGTSTAYGESYGPATFDQH